MKRLGLVAATILLVTGCRVERVDVVVPSRDGGLPDRGSEDAPQDDRPPKPPLSPQLIATPDEWNFGEVRLSASTKPPVVSILVTRSVRLPSAAPIFLKLEDTLGAFTLLDGCDADEVQSCRLVVGVNPDAPPMATKGVLHVWSSDATEAFVPLAVSPVAAPAPGPLFSFTAGTEPFASAFVGQLAEHRRVVVTNIGDTSASPAPILKAADVASSFAFTVDASDCGRELPPAGGTCTLDVAFRPYAAVLHEALLTDARAQVPEPVMLSGKGIEDLYAKELLASWRFDEDAGETLLDSSGRDNPAKLSVAGVGKFVRESGVVGTALLATKDLWAVAPSGGVLPEIQARGAVTVAAWVLSRAMPGGERFAFATGGADVAAPELALGLVGGVPTAWLAGATCKAPDALPPRWTHLALTSDGVSLTLYRDGAPVCSTGLPARIAFTEPTLGIGARPSSSSAANGVFEADLDELRVYSRALTPKDLAGFAAR